jgi:NitT/TauT family transport system substrate-binding protein
MRKSALMIITAVAAVLLAPVANAQTPVKIRMAWVAPLSNWASIWLEKKDLAKHLGKSYTVETIRFAGTPPMITALANNEIEIANLAYSTFPIAVLNAGLTDLMVISDEFQDGVGDHYTNQFYVLKDGPIKTVKDLKGKILATNAAGSAIDVAMRAMLLKNGLQDKRDYTVIEAPFPTMRAQLTEKKVDLIPAVLPFSLDPKLKEVSRALYSSKDSLGPTQFIMWNARKPFLDKNRAAMVDFMEDTLRIVRWYLDAKNQKEVMQIAAKVTKQPAERFGWLFTKQDYYRDPWMLPNLDALQKNIDATRDLGFIKSTIDVKKHADLSIVQEAAKRLK